MGAEIESNSVINSIKKYWALCCMLPRALICIKTSVYVSHCSQGKKLFFYMKRFITADITRVMSYRPGSGLGVKESQKIYFADKNGV